MQDYTQQRKNQGDQTEKKLLHAARELMNEKGFDAVSVRDICRAAGVSTGAFYHHFSSKEDMLERDYAHLNAHIRTCLEGSGQNTGLENIRRIFTGYAAYMERKNGEMTSRFYQNLLCSHALKTYDDTRLIHACVTENIQKAMEDGELAARYPARQIAVFCIRHFRGIVIDWVFHSYSYPLQEKMEEDFALLCELLAPR